MKARHQMTIIGRTLQGIILLAVFLSVFGERNLSVVQAQDSGVPKLFSEISNAQALPARQADQPFVIRSQYIYVNFELLTNGEEQAQSGNFQHEIELNLFPDVSYIGVIDKIERNDDSTSWIGTIKDKELSYFYLIVSEGTFTAHIASPDGVYEVSLVSDSLYRVIQIDQSMLPDGNDSQEIANSSTTNESTPATPNTATIMDSGSQIDVMILYTPAARAAAGSVAAMNSKVDLAIIETNTSYANSGILPRLNLVFKGEINYTESGDLQTDLEWITNAEYVNTLRNVYNADLVQLVVKNGQVKGKSSCGNGWFMNSVSSSFESSAFSVVVGPGCMTGNYSSGHEFGHNQGADHDVPNQTMPGPYPYNHGYVNTVDKWYTIMAYATGCTNCTRLQYWSNPTATYKGTTMGIASVSENYRVINNTASTVANFRQACRVALNITTQGGGTATSFPSNSPGCNYREFRSETTVTLMASPSVGWSFSHWIGASGGAVTSYTISASATVTAVFTQNNGGSDTTLPTGSWSSPSNGQSFNSSTVPLSVNATDGGSGVREVRWAAKWGGQWYGIGTDTTAPYSINWNWCAAGVPNNSNEDVEIGFEVWDNANNKWVYSEHGNVNIHIYKNYNCEPIGGVNWSVNFYGNDKTHWWDPNDSSGFLCNKTFNQGNLDQNYGDGSPCGGQTDNWVGDYRGTVNFSPGNYAFWVSHDDWLKLRLDNTEIYSVNGVHTQWVCPSNTFLSGNHEVRAIFYEDGGQARIKVEWAKGTTVCNPPGNFGKSSPLNPSFVQSTSPTLSWGVAAGATSYSYCIDTINNNACDSGFHNVGVDTSFTPSNLNPGTTYYWQVNAYSQGGVATPADGGTWWSFTTQSAAPGAFSKTSPANATSAQPTSLYLKWDSSTGAAWYQYCYDTTNNNTCDNDIWYTTLTDTSAYVSDLMENTTYYWQVRASNAGGTTSANGNTWWSFKTQIPIFNLLMRPGFEEDDMQDWWSYDAWTVSNSAYVWDFAVKHWGNKSVKIQNNSANDARWIQTVQVQPNSEYRLSGWIKTENVGHSQEVNDHGATLSTLSPLWTNSTGLLGTNDWTFVSYTFNTGSNTEITVAARLGTYSGTTTGKAWFDDLSLELLSAPQCYTLTKNASPAGGVAASPAPNCNNGTQYIHGTVIKLTANQTAGYTFSNWSGDASGATNPTYITMTENKSVIANFAQAESPTFDDVSFSHWAWNFIERLYNARITGGCGVNPLQYCPEGTVTRAQMSIFLLKGIHGSSYAPPAVGSSTGFGDVQLNHWAGKWIKQLAVEKITGGCGSGNYCPDSAVTRAQMAIFLLKAKHGTSYSPPAVGVSTGFGDVPTDHWAAKWIKQLAAEGITGGCGNGNYCPDTPVTRAQMAVFLVKTFNLP